jgi:hypothetical protein
MAVLSSDRLTLLDWARRVDPNNQIAKVVETLNQYNAVLDDISFVEGNLPTGHKVTIRASLPSPTWRLINQGVTSTKSTTNQVTEVCGMCEAYSTVDVSLAKLNGNTAEFRYSEDVAHIEGINQSFAQTLIYGDTSVDPEKFVGFAPRYYATTGATTSENVISGSGTGSVNTSVWLVGWSPATVMGIFPKGSQAGLQVKDLGEQTVNDDDGKPFQAYRTHFKWDCGIAVKDWRYVVRVANINITDLQTAGDTSDTSCNLIKLMILALDQLPPNGMVQPVFYCNKTVMSMLAIKLINKSNTLIGIEQWKTPIAGVERKTLTFLGVPVRRVDQITSTETALS